MLELLRRKKNGADSGGRSPIDVLKGTVGSLNQIPMLPEAAHRAMAVVNDPNSSLAKLSLVIEKDPALATGVLRLANSPLYRVGRTIESVDQAVVRLGMRECQNLIIAVGMRSIFGKIGRAQKQQCEILWRHSFLTACLCRQINRVLGLGYRGEEFSGGLSHDIGRILVAIGAPSFFDSADPMHFQESTETLEHEQSVLGTDHCYFGAWFANLNHLPSSLTSVIQFHHTPLDATDHHNLVGLVSMADHMANHIQRENKVDGYDPLSNLGWVFLAEKWGAETTQQYEAQALDIMAHAAQEMEEVMGRGAA